MKTVEFILIISIIGLEASSLLICSGILKGKLVTGHFGWYTNLSNYFVMFSFNYILICRIAQITPSSLLMFMVTMGILLTHWIYAFMLFPEALKQTKEGTCSYNINTYDNYILHFIAPILAAIYWFVFAEKDLTMIDGIKWLILPSLYIVYVAIRVKLNIKITDDGEVYPYFFMNVNNLGLKKVVVNIVLLAATCALLGEGILWLGGLV